MNVSIIPRKLRGTVKVPPSKSVSHRAVICASLAGGTSRLSGVDWSEDIGATIGAMRAFGARMNCEEGDSVIEIEGLPDSRLSPLVDAEINCGESGSTLRFLIPLALVAGGGVFTGRKRLFNRPLYPYFDLFGKKGVAFRLEEERLYLEGGLSAGKYALPGNVSSQFVTGLMLALPLLKGDSVIEIEGELESRGYVDLTADMLSRFGVKVKNRRFREIEIEGGQRYRPCDLTIEGDYSQAAFFLAANALGSEVLVEGLNPRSLQGDRGIVEIIGRLGGDKNEVIDASEIPDLVPIVAVLAALRDGAETAIVRAGRLRLKESDRLSAIRTELSKLGADIEETAEDSLFIRGKKELEGGICDAWGDHRIAMALAIAATAARDEIIIAGAESVSKSYPRFWEDYASLGGILG